MLPTHLPIKWVNKWMFVYDPTNPNTAQIDSYFERWVFPVIIIPAMILAALILNFFMILLPGERGEPIGE